MINCNKMFVTLPLGDEKLINEMHSTLAPPHTKLVTMKIEISNNKEREQGYKQTQFSKQSSKEKKGKREGKPWWALLLEGTSADETGGTKKRAKDI